MRNLQTDEELALKAQAGDLRAEEALVERYWSLAAILAAEYPVPGIERDDRRGIVLQAFMSAIGNWTPGRGSRFKSYAKLCARNRLADEYRKASSGKAVPNVKKVSIDAPVDAEDGSVQLEEVLAGPCDTVREVEAR